MNIGQLRERITLQYQTKVSDSMGSYTMIWNDYATIWAKAWTVSSMELSVDTQVGLLITQKFCIRFRKFLKSDWRIKWGDRYFNIVGIDPDQKREFIYITAKEA